MMMMMMKNLSGSVQCKVGAEWEGAAVHNAEVVMENGNWFSRPF